MYSILVLLLACSSQSKGAPEGYHSIKISEVFSKMIVRDSGDRVYSGLIRSADGIREFEKAYGIDLGNLKVNFATQTLLFGITDNFSSRAFQLLEQVELKRLTLDYGETGIAYKLGGLEQGKKYSFLQVFITGKINGNPHISVKNSINNGVSKFF